MQSQLCERISLSSTFILVLSLGRFSQSRNQSEVDQQSRTLKCGQSGTELSADRAQKCGDEDVHVSFYLGVRRSKVLADSQLVYLYFSVYL